MIHLRNAVIERGNLSRLVERHLPVVRKASITRRCVDDGDSALKFFYKFSTLRFHSKRFKRMRETTALCKLITETHDVQERPYGKAHGHSWLDLNIRNDD